MLDLGKGNVVEKLDEELTGEVGLVAGSPSMAMRMAGEAITRVYKVWILDVGSRENQIG